jgi:tetratricopeptide (TPR) repeat protein
MLSKWLIALIVGVVGMVLWMFFHPSYQKSLESRLSYSMGRYDIAYTLAKESFELDPYNRMASTVMAQSQMALKYVRYNELAEKYKKEIHRIAEQKSVTPQDQAKIKMMSQIMIDSYRKNASTVVIDKDLVERAHSNYEQFKMLHDELTSPR